MDVGSNPTFGIYLDYKIEIVIYFLTYENLPGYVKIGYSQAESLYGLSGRLASFATSNPSPVVVLGTMPGSRSKETQLHRRFKDYRVRNEWFVYCGELRKLLEEQADNFNKDRTPTPAFPGSSTLRETPKYVFQKNEGDIWFYHRKVPVDVQQFFNSKFVYERLDHDFKTACDKALAVTQRIEEEWEALRQLVE